MERRMVKSQPAKESLRKKAITLFVSNLHDEKSKPELDAMFSRAGRLPDNINPTDKPSGKKRGFAFICFRSRLEAERSIDLAQGQYWGGCRIHVQNSRFVSANTFNCLCFRSQHYWKFVEGLRGPENKGLQSPGLKGTEARL